MARSAFDDFTDTMLRRPEWVERDGPREVLVRGFSLLDGLAAVLGGSLVVAAAIAVLAVMP